MERDAFAKEIKTWLQNSGAVKSLQTKLRKVYQGGNYYNEGGWILYLYIYIYICICIANL